MNLLMRVVRDEQSSLIFSHVDDEICVHEAALLLVLLNLISNAVKLGAGQHTRIEIDFKLDDDRITPRCLLKVLALQQNGMLQLLDFPKLQNL